MKSTKFKIAKSDIFTVVGMIFIGLLVAVVVYPFLHEGGHSLAAYMVGANVIEFHVLPIPYVMCNVQSLSVVRQIVIGISGMSFPLVIAMLMPRQWYWSWYARFILLGISLLAFAISAVTLLLPNGDALNPQDDMLRVSALWPKSESSLIVILIIISALIVLLMIKDRPLKIICKKFGI